MTLSTSALNALQQVVHYTYMNGVPNPIPSHDAAELSEAGLVSLSGGLAFLTEKGRALDVAERSPATGDISPWGEIQGVEQVGEKGVVFVTTASHGGMWVPRRHRGRFTQKARAFASKWSKGHGWQWFEEDCAVAYVVMAMPECFDACVLPRATEQVESMEAVR